MPAAPDTGCSIAGPLGGAPPPITGPLIGPFCPPGTIIGGDTAGGRLAALPGVGVETVLLGVLVAMPPGTVGVVPGVSCDAGVDVASGVTRVLVGKPFGGVVGVGSTLVGVLPVMVGVLPGTVGEGTGVTLLTGVGVLILGVLVAPLVGTVGLRPGVGI